MAEDHYLGNPLLKKTNTPVQLSQEQVLELAKCSKDVIYFAKNYIKIVTSNDGLVNFKPYEFQEQMLKNFHEKRFNICKLPRQPLWVDTPIPTPDGWKTMGDLKVGGYVFNPKGEPTKILKKSKRFVSRPCYKIHFNCGETIIADEEHLWEVNTSEKEELALMTSEIYDTFNESDPYFIKQAITPSGYDKPEHDGDHYITKIEITDTVDVQCITVDCPSHLFLCGNNFIPTHNSGKSTTTVTFLVHCLLFEEYTSIAILANKASTAKDILGRLQTAYENLPRWMQQGVKSWNKTSMELENGSKVVAASTSASSVRGGTYSILMLDEYAFVPEHVADTFMKSVYPTITSGDNTKAIIVSTPCGLNHYYKMWVNANLPEGDKNKNEYHPFEIHWSDVPGRDENWKRTQIANIGQKAFDQEFNTDFLGSSDTLISASKLNNLVLKNPIRTTNSLDVYEEPEKDHIYVTIVDTAKGVEKDYSAAVVVDVSILPYNVVAKYRNNEIRPEMYSYVIKDIAMSYNESYLLCEVNEIGYQVARDLLEDGYPNMLMCSTKSRSGQVIGQNLSGKHEIGVKMQKNIKKLGSLNLKTLIEEDKLCVNDLDIFAELTTFVQKGTIFEAESGKNDDLVDCLVLFSWLTTNQYFKDITDINLRRKLLEEREAREDEDLLPFGYSNFNDESEVIDNGLIWTKVEDDEMNAILHLFNYY